MASGASREIRADAPRRIGAHYSQAVTDVHRIETEFAGRTLILETGRLARQAAGSVLIRFGDTVVLAAVTVSPNMSSLPFFPLTVEYKEYQARSHFTPVEPGWEEVADYALDWAVGHVR